MRVDDQYDGEGAGEEQDEGNTKTVPLMRLLKLAHEALKSIEYIDMMDDEPRCPDCMGSPHQDGHSHGCKLKVFYLIEPVLQGKPIPEGPPCSECGCYKDDVHKRVDPYSADILDKIVKLTMCDDCTDERARDI
jgi:hypothetical protein